MRDVHVPDAHPSADTPGDTEVKCRSIVQGTLTARHKLVSRHEHNGVEGWKKATDHVPECKMGWCHVDSASTLFRLKEEIYGDVLPHALPGGHARSRRI